MKSVLKDYTFDASAQTITINDRTSVDLNRLLLITNVTDNITIYQFNDNTLGGSVATNVITLDYDTTTMSDTDDLQIFYEEIEPYGAYTPDQEDVALFTKAKPQNIDRISFAKAIANNVDPDWATLLVTGAGQTVNQTNGSLVLTAGTTARAETIIRSLEKYKGGIRLRARTTLSQRIANNNFFVELVDVVGDGLDYSITNATTLVVTFPTGTNPFTAQNIGQGIFAGNFVGTGTFLSGRYAINAVSGDTVTFTVAGFVAGTGTLSLFGWNYYHLLYDATTATQAKFDTQRNGYNSGDTTATISTTASPGHLAIITGNDVSSVFSDQLVASSGAVRTTVRASRDENVPDDKELYIQIRVANGSTAPASQTTWTIGFVGIGNFAGQDVTVQDMRQTTNIPLPIEILRSVSLAVTMASTALGAGTSAIGKIATTGVWQDSTSTNLGASATFTGTSRDLLGTATNTAFSVATAYAKEYRIEALADVVGDLYLEVSRDNTTFRRVKKVTAVQNAGSGQPFYAEIVHAPKTRYARAVYINGAGAQTYFALQETMIGV